MATQGAGAAQLTPEHPIVIKVAINGTNRKFKLPLKELNAAALPQKLRSILQIPSDQPAVFERFSDSSNAYLTLDPANPSTYKQLYRAAKAKLKLRLRVTLPQQEITDIASLVKTETEKETTPLTTVAPSAPQASMAPKPLPEVIQPAPPKPRVNMMNQLAAISKPRKTGRNLGELLGLDSDDSFWQVFCNNCDKSMSDAHFHCGVCDDGDFDLCEDCVNAGIMCQGHNHWLIKRFVKDGEVFCSTTEKINPTNRKKIAKENVVPGAFKIEEQVAKFSIGETRTCNSCIAVFPHAAFVECNDCEDFDLCIPCHADSKHGHHPGHTFSPADPGSAAANEALKARCQPGGSVRHGAICDKCDKKIIGVRHKCLDCPDWDYCNKCHADASKHHPGHRFVPIYEPLAVTYRNAPGTTEHHGIYCDGPLCSGKPYQTYIRGSRYKCAICHDTDFCANCEAHPDNKHNITHPLIKFKTHVRGVAVTTSGDDGRGQTLPLMGDRNSASNETLPAYTPSTYNTAPIPASVDAELDAHFVRDTITDGTSITCGEFFTQTWTMRNPGPKSWPAGSRVKFVGGDDMGGREWESSSWEPTPPGQELLFMTKLQAPTRAGKHISYWRMHTPEGLPFGHKLWCDIMTTAANQPCEPGRETDAAKSQDMPVPADEIRPSGARPMMPTIKHAARFAMPHKVRYHAMELQNRQRELREQWRKSPETRAAITLELQQLQMQMLQFTSVYRPAPQSLVPVENNEMRELLAKQRLRSVEINSMAEGQEKQTALQRDLKTHNDEMHKLLRQQRQRRQGLRMQSPSHAEATATSSSAACSSAASSSNQTQQSVKAQPTINMPLLPTQTTSHAQYLQEVARLTALENARKNKTTSEAAAAKAFELAQNRSKVPAPSVEDLEPEPAAAAAEGMQKSDMVFPRLEKESPCSSVELPKAESTSTASGATAVTSPPPSLSAASEASEARFVPTSHGVNLRRTESLITEPNGETRGAECIEYSPVQSLSSGDEDEVEDVELDDPLLQKALENDAAERTAMHVGAQATAVVEPLEARRAREAAEEKTAEYEEGYESVHKAEAEQDEKLEVEVVTADEADAEVEVEDDGFDTDEYDILDASDEELYSKP